MRCFSLVAILFVVGCTAPAADDDGAATSSAEAYSTSGSKVTTRDRASGAESATGGCTSSPNTDFVVRYENESLPWGTRVVLHSGYGFYEGPPYDWLDTRDDEARSVAPWTWEATRHVDWHGAAAGPLRLDFAVQIILPDGRVVWDTNGKPGYYYMAEWSGRCDGGWHASPMFDPVR